MEQARNFVYEQIRQKRLNIGSFLEYKWLWQASALESPIIKNNYLKILEEMLEEGLLEEREGHPNGAFLTKKGFDVVYNQ